MTIVTNNRLGTNTTTTRVLEYYDGHIPIYIHHVTYWCTGGCRNKSISTPPITWWNSQKPCNSRLPYSPPGGALLVYSNHDGTVSALWFVHLFYSFCHLTANTNPSSLIPCVCGLLRILTEYLFLQVLGFALLPQIPQDQRASHLQN